MRRALIILCLAVVAFAGCAQEPEYDVILLPVLERSGGWGFVDRHGAWITQPKYEMVEILVGGMARVHLGGLWGYVNEEGTEVVEPMFDEANRFSEGKGAVGMQGSYGFLDMSGEVVIPLEYSFAYPFSDSLAAVRVDSLFGFIDHHNNMVLEPTYVYAREFKEGFARVTPDSLLFGLINKKGQVLGGRWFEDVRPASDGRFAFMRGRLWGYMDLEGNVIVPPTYTYAQDFKEGRAVVGFEHQGMFAIIDAQGNTVVEQGRYSFIRPYRDGYAGVRRSGSWGFVDRDGNEVIPPAKGSSYRDFSEDRAAFQDSTGAWGFVDKSGKVVIPARFESAYEFQDGVCYVKVGGKRGYIDRHGNYIWEPSF